MFRVRIGTPNALVCAGGVAANQAIRKVLHRVAFEVGTELVAPPPALCTDNAAMIAWAGAERLALGLTDPLDFAPRARWPLDQVAKSAETAEALAAGLATKSYCSKRSMNQRNSRIQISSLPTVSSMPCSRLGLSLTSMTTMPSAVCLRSTP